MKTISINVYSYDELSEEAQRRALKNCWEFYALMICRSYDSDYERTLKAMEPIFKIKLDARAERLIYKGDLDPDEPRLLARYLRDAASLAYKGTTYRKKGRTRESMILQDVPGYDFTGVCTDQAAIDALENRYNFLREGATIRDFVQALSDEFLKAWKEDNDFAWNSKEVIEEQIQLNEPEFLADGEVYKF